MYIYIVCLVQIIDCWISYLTPSQNTVQYSWFAASFLYIDFCGCEGITDVNPPFYYMYHSSLYCIMYLHVFTTKIPIPLIRAIEYLCYRCCWSLWISEEGNRDCRTTQSYRSCKKSSSQERILQRYRINVFIIIDKLPFQFLACLYIMHDFVTCVECTWTSDRMCLQSALCAYSFTQLWRKKLVERMWLNHNRRMQL